MGDGSRSERTRAKGWGRDPLTTRSDRSGDENVKESTDTDGQHRQAQSGRDVLTTTNPSGAIDREQQKGISCRAA